MFFCNLLINKDNCQKKYGQSFRLVFLMDFLYTFIVLKLIRNDMKRNLYLLLLLLLGAMPISAQVTLGTDFWVTLLPVGRQGDTPEPMLWISADASTSGSVSNPNTGWQEDFFVEAGRSLSIPIPLEQAFEMHLSDTVLNTGLHVTAKIAVSVIVANYEGADFDTSKALPTNVLGSEYMIQTYECFGTYDFLRSVVSVVATEDNTTVDFQLTCETKNGHPANQPLSVTLDAGQVYQLQSAHLCNFSGTRITARDGKPIAVFAGNRGLGVPYYNTDCIDHAEEVMLPATTLGRHFVVTRSLRCPPDYVRITALKNHCEIRRDGVLLRTLNAGQSFHFELTDEYPAIYIETSEPAIVSKFYHGFDDIPGGVGDPAMATILPIEQQTDRALFCAYSTHISRWHYLNVVTETASVAGMRLDGEPIDDQFDVVPGNPEYAYARLQIVDTTHTLINTEGGFVAHVYGMGCAEAYAYFPDAAMLTTALTVNDTSEWLHPEGFYEVMDEPVDFGLLLNYEMSEAHWDFGDGSSAVLTDAEAWHSYNAAGNYLVTCEVFRTDLQGRQMVAGYVSTVIRIDPWQVDENDHREEISLFPNPATTQMKIEGHDIHCVRLTNGFGQVVMEQSYESIDQLTLDVSELPQGVYSVEVVTANERFIKQLVICEK